jgi:prepilin-type N-terminal cleavage/methylation domain-containing protein
MRRTQHAFTLAEILIVVIILAILAAISISQVQQGPLEARSINLRENLSKIRMQLALYRQQHNAFPSATNFEQQMTEFTNQQGECAESRSGDFRYPPYLEQMPCNPISGSRAIRATNDPEVIAPQATTDGGWWYNEATGRFYADLTYRQIDTDGTRFCAY